MNTLKTDIEKLLRSFSEKGIDASAHPQLSNCIFLGSTGAVSSLPGFSEGEFYVQDCAAYMAVLAAEPKAGERIIDVCSAPGGKSFVAGILSKGKADIISCDIHENKLKRIRESAARLGLDNIETLAADGREFRPEFEERFDLVIADVPCSGLGVIRKKPDIRFKDLSEFDALPKIQKAILENVSRYVKRGGRIIYSTCTVREEENRAIAETFLAENTDFAAEDFTLPGIGMSEKGMMQLWPQRHGTDGFFIAKFRRK